MKLIVVCLLGMYCTSLMVIQIVNAGCSTQNTKWNKPGGEFI